MIYVTIAEIFHLLAAVAKSFILDLEAFLNTSMTESKRLRN